MPAACQCMSSKKPACMTHPHTRVGGVLDGIDERVVLGVEVDGPRAVNDASWLSEAVAVALPHKPFTCVPKSILQTSSYCAALNMQHISADSANLEHGGVAGVGGVVCGDVVEGAARGEGQTALQTTLVDQLTGLGLETLADINHGHARLDPGLHVLADLLWGGLGTHGAVGVGGGRTCRWASAAWRRSLRS